MREALRRRRLLATHVAEGDFVRAPESVRAARQFATGVVNGWEMPELADAVELVTSELATNAVQHTRADEFQVTIHRLSDGLVRVAVTDRSCTPPAVYTAGDDEDHGRGLFLVERVAARWDTELLPHGKSVWADLEMPLRPGLSARHARLQAQAIYLLIVLTVASLLVAGVAAHR